MSDSARKLLESLVGREITTITGRPNRILRVDGDQVVVATTRSPNGQKVPVEWVQEALDRLVQDRALTISVASVRYRSAFIGAVLSQLPGAEVDRSKSPPRIRLSRPNDSVPHG
jgi:hypothetical protein